MALTPNSRTPDAAALAEGRGDATQPPAHPPGLIHLQPVLYAVGPRGDSPGVYVPVQAVKELFGVDIQGGDRPASISTRVVLEVVGTGERDSTSSSNSVGAGPLSIASGPFEAKINFQTSSSPNRMLFAQLVCMPLQRAVVGLARVGVRRVDAHTIALVLASPAHAARVAQAHAHGQLVPLLRLVTYQCTPSGRLPHITLPQAVAMALFGLEPKALPPTTLTTAVVLEVEGGVGAGAPPSRGPFTAAVRVSSRCRATGAVALMLLCTGLQRAVVGWQRVGMRRVDAGTIALVLARPGGQQAQGGGGADAA